VTTVDDTTMSSHAPSALVVDPIAASRLRTVTALAGAGFHVISTDAFEAARHQIVVGPPAVLVTALKLLEYNGLHLVLRARAASPGTACLVTADERTNFQNDAEQAGATYLVDPVNSAELMAAVFRTLFRSDGSARVSPPFERRRADRRRTSGADHVPDRRLQDRRRDPMTLMLAASAG